MTFKKTFVAFAIIFAFLVTNIAVAQNLPIPKLKIDQQQKNEVKKPSTRLRNSLIKRAGNKDGKKKFRKRPRITSKQILDNQDIPPEKKLEILKRRTVKSPKDLDAFFGYAKLAGAMSKHEEAESAYLHMLEMKPSLSRVKLDLGLLYIKMGKLLEAKTLFTQVLATNPPEAVKNNVDSVMVIVDNALKKHIYSGLLSIGTNIDKNANSAASTGQTTFNDASLDLSPSSTATRDVQTVLMAMLKHTYKMDKIHDGITSTWDTTGLLYRTEQRTLENINIMLYSIETGPVVNFPEYKTKLSTSLGYSSISLENTEFLVTRLAKVTGTYTIKPTWTMNSGFKFENRKYFNAPKNTTYTLKTGKAYETTFGTTYVLPTGKDILSSTITWRNEDSMVAYNDNVQRSITGTYIRQLPYGFSTNLVLGFKKSRYKGPDTSISSLTRRDLERSATLTISKKFENNITASLGYQYKNLGSTIQNYDYVNHRVSTSLAWGF